jgi:uncharacterized protein DUF3999
LSRVPLAAALPALVLAAATPGVAVRRPLEAAVEGKVAVALDADVYERARSDLGDLRVVDDRGAQVPYVLQRVGDGPPATLREPVTVNRGFVRGQGATATLDFGAPALKSELALSLPGDNFRRRVRVEGRNRPDAAWTTLTDGAYVFAVPGPPPARYETVSLPENDYELLRVTVFRAPDDPPVFEIRQARIRPAPARRLREAPLTRTLVSRAEDARTRETVLTLDLGARFQPFVAVTFDVADPRFLREVAVEARRAGRPGKDGAAPPPYWIAVATGALYRYEEAGRVHERLRVEACGREQALRVRVRNRDDHPLDLRGLSVLVPVERVVFEARPPRLYAVEYGLPERSAPSYDMARTVGDTDRWAADAAPAALGPAQPVTGGAARVAWTERHPALLWAGLVAAVAVLGALTWRAIRAAG